MIHHDQICYLSILYRSYTYGLTNIDDTQPAYCISVTHTRMHSTFWFHMRS